MKAALAQEFHSYIKNANHSIENLTDNGDLETCDGQLLLMHLSMFCPRMGGGGGGGRATPREFDSFRLSNVNFPIIGYPLKAKFPPLGIPELV